MYLKVIANNPHPKFEIYDNGEPVIGIKIDPEMQTVRVTYKEKKRVFFIVEEKLRKHHLITLLNEYSQPLGSLVKDKSNNSGEIEIEDMKFAYKLAGAEHNQINLAEINNPRTGVNCEIENEAISSAMTNINYLLFSLSWVAFLVKEEKENFQFA